MVSRRYFLSQMGGIIPGIYLSLPRSVVKFTKAKALSRGPQHHFYGYYGINPWDATQQYHLALETNFHDRPTVSSDIAQIGVIHKKTNQFIKYGTTSAFNFQQGSMMHWIDAGYGEEFTCNEFMEGKLLSTAIHFSNRNKRTIQGAIAALSPRKDEGIGLNFVRMGYCRPTVGYANPFKSEKYELINAPKDDGLFRLNLKTGTSELILSIAEVVSMSDLDEVKDKPAWFNHVLYNPSGDRLLFFCRVKLENGWFSSLWTVNSDGSNLQCQIPFKNWISHFAWKDEKTLLVTTDLLGKKQFVQFTDNKKDFTPMGVGVLPEDGHQSYSPDRKWLVCDTYPDKGTRLSELMLYHIEKNKKISLGKFYHDPRYYGVYRCDLHPRWSPDGKMITFDSIHEGTRQIYYVDVSQIV